jgi:hypothetical protein
LLSLGLLALGFCGVASGQTFRAITSEGPWGNCEAFPDVCRMANGDLYVVFYAGYGHVSKPRDDLPRGGAVYGLRSSDEGKTWSDPILVVDTPEDERDPHVTQLANGDLLAAMRCRRGRSAGIWDSREWALRNGGAAISLKPPPRVRRKAVSTPPGAPRQPAQLAFANGPA